MAASSFRVSWNRFPSHVLSALDNLRLDEDFVDVSIYCGRRLIKAHRNVLSASSAYFKEIFKANPSSHPVVILCDVDHASLRSLVDFMYHGEIEVPTARLDELLRLGEMLQVQGISSHKGLSSEDASCTPPAPGPPPEPEPEPLPPPGDAITPECVITEPGRRRRRSRHHTASPDEEVVASHVTADPGHSLPAANSHVPPPGPAPGSLLGCGPSPAAELQRPDGQLRVKSEWPEEPAREPPDTADSLLLDDTEQSGVDMSQYSGGIFASAVGSRRPLTGAERARRYRERKKLKKLYEALLGGSPRREQLTVQL